MEKLTINLPILGGKAKYKACYKIMNDLEVCVGEYKSLSGAQDAARSEVMSALKNAPGVDIYGFALVYKGSNLVSEKKYYKNKNGNVVFQ